MPPFEPPHTATSTPAEAVLAENGIEPEYFAAVDPETFETPGDLIVIAATIGTTRLIDNAKAATPERRGADPKEPSVSSPPREQRPITLLKLAEKRALGEPIVIVTAYDHPSAAIVDDAGVDVVLVGDSAANNVLGYRDTVPITMDELLMLARAVRRGLKTPLMVGDLPFGTYEASDEQAIATAHRFVKEAGCDAVKLEGGGQMAQRARAIIEAGTPVMGHVGLTPQTATALGGYRAQGRTAERAKQVLDDALALQDAGCFSIVFEAIPNELTDLIMEHMEIPVIGIGAGPSTDGQVLVYHDLLGINDAFKPEVRQALRRAAPADGRRRDGLRRGGPHPRLPRPGARVRRRSGGDGAAQGDARREARARLTNHSQLHWRADARPVPSLRAA